MPFNAALMIAIVGLIIALGVWFKTKRIGPTFGILLGAFVVAAITDTSLITRGGQLVGDGIEWAFDTVISAF